MSVESSQDRTEQTQPRLATSGATGHNSAVQREIEGEQLLTNVPPVPVPSDPNTLVDLLLSWMSVSDWSTSQTYLQVHPELLTEAAAQVMATLAQYQGDQQVHKALTLHQQLLQMAGQQGVEAAYESLLLSEELQAQAITWLQTPDWQTSQTYLQNHHQLLTDAAEQAMQELKLTQREQLAHAIIDLHQDLLQKARLEGIEVV